jgi:hypothetical protein
MGLSLDFKSAAVVATPDPCSETNEKLLLNQLGTVKQIWVPLGLAAELEPEVPVFGFQAVIHFCSGNCLPSSVDVTSKIHLGMRGLLLWEGKAGVKMGEERVVTDDIKTAGSHVGHVIVNACNGAKCQGAGLDRWLEGRQTRKESARGGCLGVIGHAFGPCHGGCVIGPNTGPDVPQVNHLLQDHVVEEHCHHFEVQVGQAAPGLVSTTTWLVMYAENLTRHTMG